MNSGVPVRSCQLKYYCEIRHKLTAVGAQKSLGKRCVVHAGNRRQLQVVFVTTEVTPWSKVGGLGDVMAALPAALAARGHRVMTVSPMYSDYFDVRDTGVKVPVRLPVDAQQQQQQKDTRQTQQDAHQEQAEKEQEQEQPLAPQQLQQPEQQQQVLQAATGLQRSKQQDQHQLQEHQQRGEPAICPGLQQHQGTSDVELHQTPATDAAAPHRQEHVVCSHELETGSAGDAQAADGMSRGQYARYYMCCSAGVHRVFVDHPVYHGGGTSRGDGRPWPAAILSSYTHPAAAAAGRAGPDLAAAASVLCQAALAAPLLLWGVSGGLEGQQAHGQQQQQEAQMQHTEQHRRQQEQQQQLEMEVLMQLLGLDNTVARTAASVGKDGSGCGVAAVLAAAAERQQTHLALHLQYPQQIVAGLASPVLLGTAGSEVDSRWQVSDLLLPQQQLHKASTSLAAGDDAPVLFIANDWPCGVLPLWLGAYRQQAQHWQQQDNPHLQWLRQQQQEVFNQIKPQELKQQQCQQELQPTIALGVKALVQTALEACSSSSSSSHDSCDSTSSGSSDRPCDICDVFGDYAAVYVNGTDLKRSSAPQQQLLQELHQEWQLQHDSSSASKQRVMPAEQGSRDQSVEVAGSSSGSSSSWSAAADAWLQGVGYEPGSVFDAELSALVAAAVQAGRVPQQRLPELAALQSQLQQALKQEQVLGEAIDRLRTATVKIPQVPQQLHQHDQQQKRADHHHNFTSTQTAIPCNLMAGTTGAIATAVCAIDHQQGLSVLQRMLGRQLKDSKVVFTIHTFGYQGLFRGRSNFDRLGLPQHMLPAFMAPVAQAAATAGKVAAQAAAAAASAVGSQLAALAEALQRLMPSVDTSSSANSNSSSTTAKAGLLSTVQQAVLQAKVEEMQHAGAAAGGQVEHSQPNSQRQQSAANAAAQHYHQQPDTCCDDVDVELNWLRAGVSASDVAVTVSRSYAQQLLQGSWEASGVQPDNLNSSSSSADSMAALLASKKLRGILNGLDTHCWDPATDPLLPAAVRYSAASAAAGKAAAKQLLQRRLGLHVDPAAPLFAFIGRLTPQKGVDVILAAAPALLTRPAAAAAAQPAPVASSRSLQQHQRQPGSKSNCLSAAATPVEHPAHCSCQHGAAGGVAVAAAPGVPQLVLLGTGERWMEEVLGQLADRYAGRAVGVADFNEPLAHLILAAADALLVPSRFEPCGLVALAGLRYGAVPIVSATGGLVDVVSGDVGYLVDNPGPEGDTAAFRQGVRDLGAAMQQVVQEYGTQEFAAKRAAAMAVDVSWDAPCDAWEQVLQQLLEQDTAAAGAAAGSDGVGGRGISTHGTVAPADAQSSA